MSLLFVSKLCCLLAITSIQTQPTKSNPKDPCVMQGSCISDQSCLAKRCATYNNENITGNVTFLCLRTSTTPPYRTSEARVIMDGPCHDEQRQSANYAERIEMGDPCAMIDLCAENGNCATLSNREVCGQNGQDKMNNTVLKFCLGNRHSSTDAIVLSKEPCPSAAQPEQL